MNVKQTSKYPTIVQLSIISAFVDMSISLYDAGYKGKKSSFLTLYTVGKLFNLSGRPNVRAAS